MTINDPSTHWYWANKSNWLHGIFGVARMVFDGCYSAQDDVELQNTCDECHKAAVICYDGAVDMEQGCWRLCCQQVSPEHQNTMHSMRK